MHSTLDFCPDNPGRKLMYRYIREAKSLLSYYILCYKGCGGNLNRFFTKKDCEQLCQPTISSAMTESTIKSNGGGIEWVIAHNFVNVVKYQAWACSFCALFITVNSRFKKDLNLQIHLHRAYFFNQEFTVLRKDTFNVCFLIGIM